jgi:hypothetical protein
MDDGMEKGLADMRVDMKTTMELQMDKYKAAPVSGVTTASKQTPLTQPWGSR